MLCSQILSLQNTYSLPISPRALVEATSNALANHCPLFAPAQVLHIIVPETYTPRYFICTLFCTIVYIPLK